MISRKVISLLLILIIFISGCQSSNITSQIVLYSSVPETIGDKPINNSKEEIRVALASVLSPKASLSKYKYLLDYIGEEMGVSIEIIQKQSYQEVDRMLKSGEVDIAFICSLSYVLGLKGQYIVDVAAPVVKGKALYKSYTIVNKNSVFEKLEDLDGKKFAYTDPYSYTGRLSILNQLYQKGYSLTDFFADTFFTYSHDYSVKAVELGIVDGATVDGVLFDQLQKEKPELSSQVRIIGTGAEAGTPPVVASRFADSQFVEEFSSVLLNLQNVKEGKEILKELGFDAYAPINQKDYRIIQNGLFLLGETS